MSRAADIIVRLATKSSAPFVPRITHSSLGGRPMCQMVNIQLCQQRANPALVPPQHCFQYPILQKLRGTQVNLTKICFKVQQITTCKLCILLYSKSCLPLWRTGNTTSHKLLCDTHAWVSRGRGRGRARTGKQLI